VHDSDCAQLVRDLARSLGSRRVVSLGAPRPDTEAGLEGELELVVHDNLYSVPSDPDDVADALILCDSALSATEDARPLLELLGSLLRGASAGILSCPDGDLRSDDAPTAAPARGARELIALLEASGITVDWLLLALAGTESARVRELLVSGARNLLFDPLSASGQRLDRRLRVCIASYEFVGPTRTGGIGTAYTSLAEALADAGHEVTVLYTGWREAADPPFSRWADHYRERGIRLLELDALDLPRVHCGHYNAERSYLAYRWLSARDREQPFDVVHFPDTLGHGFYTVLAKRQGWAFARTTLAVGLHSPSRWILEANRTAFHTGQDFADDHLERAVAERADVLISPSAYIADWSRAQGWRLPARSFVQQYVSSREIERLARRPPPGLEPIRELVFFGRLEVRKGLVLFCDALDLLAADGRLPEISITFLGRQAEVERVSAFEYLDRRAKDWPWEWRVLDRLNQPEAVAYLRGRGRLALMPSLLDNTPNTVMEALALGIPFIASRAGGTAELIHPVDLARAAFDPTGPRAVAALADAIADAVSAERFEPPRPAVDAAANERVHVAWNEGLAAASEAGAGVEPAARARAEAGMVTACLVSDGAAPPEAAVRSLQAQDHARVEVVVAPSERQRNHAVRPSRAEWLLFLHPRAIPEPRLVAALTSVGEAADAEVVSCATRWLFDDGGHALRAPEGGPPVAGLFYKCFGEAAYAIRRELFERLDGFNPAAVGALDHELLCRAALAGARFEVVPEPLVQITGSNPVEAEMTDYPNSALAVVDAYGRTLPTALRDLPLAGRAFWQLGKRRDTVVTTVLGSTSWRITRPMRRISRLLRRLRGLPPGVEPE
jgi:glycosyltransferase involved in cell wall biosynthesis